MSDEMAQALDEFGAALDEAIEEIGNATPAREAAAALICIAKQLDAAARLFLVVAREEDGL